MSTTTDSSTPTVENRADSVDKSSEGTLPGSRVAESYAYQATWNQPQVKVQLRPVSPPSPVTLLFEYTLKAWNHQKGDHCTYKYVSSRDPSVPMEITATVLVRMPQKQPLLVRDTKSRVSRVQAQNAVAQLALERLSMDDPELEAQLEAIRKDQASAPPPPPVFNRFQSSPGRYMPPRSVGHYPQPHFQQMFQYYGYPPAAPPSYFAPPPRSNSAPELQEDQMVSPPPPPPFYGVPPQIETGFGEDESMIATPTIPYYGYAPMTPQAWGGYHPEMMGGYYAPPPMMMVPPPHHMMNPAGEPSRDDEPSSH